MPKKQWRAEVAKDKWQQLCTQANGYSDTEASLRRSSNSITMVDMVVPLSSCKS